MGSTLLTAWGPRLHSYELYGVHAAHCMGSTLLTVWGPRCSLSGVHVCTPGGGGGGGGGGGREEEEYEDGTCSQRGPQEVTCPYSHLGSRDCSVVCCSGRASGRACTLSGMQPAEGNDAPLRNWVVSDINTDVLHRHCAPTLERLGATIMEIDIFQMFRHVELAAGPALVIMGCVCPPVSHRDSLGRYINKYQNYNPNGYERRMWYDAFAFEAVVGQMSRATVVQIVRAGDSV